MTNTPTFLNPRKNIWYLQTNRKHILGKCREHFKDLLNRVTKTLSEKSDEHFWEYNTITESKIFLVLETLKAADCDKIRLDKFKNHEWKLNWLTRLSNGLVLWETTE